MAATTQTFPVILMTKIASPSEGRLPSESSQAITAEQREQPGGQNTAKQLSGRIPAIHYSPKCVLLWDLCVSTRRT